MKDAIKFKGIDETQIEQYKPKKLGVKMFLDFDENERILADMKFCYGGEEFNPLQQKIEIKYPRDVIAENKAINMLRKTGFMYYEQKECFILPDDDKIYAIKILSLTDNEGADAIKQRQLDIRKKRRERRLNKDND